MSNQKNEDELERIVHIAIRAYNEVRMMDTPRYKTKFEMVRTINSSIAAFCTASSLGILIAVYILHLL